MALDPKYTVRRLYESSQLSQFDLRLAPTGNRIDTLLSAQSHDTGHFFRSDLLRDEYDTTYQIIKKKFMISDKNIMYIKIYVTQDINKQKLFVSFFSYC